MDAAQHDPHGDAVSGRPYLIGFPTWANRAFGWLMQSDTFADRFGWRFVRWLDRRIERRRRA